jgi:biopolymer transport protein ExbB/TolQ
MIWAAWMTAGAGLIAAITNTILVLRRTRQVTEQLTEHAERIGQLENGGSPVP